MRNTLNLFLLLILSNLLLKAQNTDSLFNAYIQHYGNVKDKTANTIQSTKPDNKCGFGITNTIMQHFNEFTPDQQAILSTMLDRPVERETSIVSPSGLFRIHYDLTGIHRPNYFSIPGMTDAEITQMSVDSLAAAFDKSYDFEVNYLGYETPIFGDNNLGGDNLYDVYISNYSDYGVTTTDGDSPGSYITIENDFVGNFYTTGMAAAKATAAHEFHHAIQLAHYGFYSTEREFYELTSTAMEEFVYDEVNDYYGYMNSYFSRTYDTFKNFSGYDLAAFYLFLHQKYAQQGDDFKGHKIIKNAWEIFGITGSDVEAISSSLFENGTSLKNTWNEFGLWCYFTNNRTKPGYYFEEAENYPLVRPFASYEFIPPTKEFSFNTEPFSNNYIFFEINSENFRDTLISIITNADSENGKAYPYISSEISYKLTILEEPGTYKIVNEYQSLLTADMKDLFAEGNIFNNEIVAGGDLNREVVDFAFPQPFRYSEHKSVYFPVEPNPLGVAYLNIYSTSMDLVYDSKLEIIAGDKVILNWNGLDNGGNKLSTGIYLFITKSEDKVKKGKIVIYND